MAEKSPFLDIHHVGAVVRDLEKAIEYYESLGIGPFKILKLPGIITEQTMNGKPVEFQLRNAVVRLGPVELELIQPIENAVLQEDFLESRGEGINHLGFKVDDFDKERAKLEEKGLDVIYPPIVLKGTFLEDAYNGRSPKRSYMGVSTGRSIGII